jgi:four helix bundle protein
VKVRTYKDLVVYKKAYELAVHVYKITERYPDREKFVLCNQMRRSALSIPSNIAEGYRRGKKEYIQFLKIAYGSCAELETLLLLSRDLGYLNERDFTVINNIQNEVSRILNSLLRKLGDSK